jgi:phosphoribosylglycinamide formyltransferase 1
MKNLGILLSGRGSNFEAIAKNVAGGRIANARIAIVISNRSEAGGIALAQRLGIETAIIVSKGKSREDHDREMVSMLHQHKVDLVCLAGYMRLLSPWFVRQFPHRILNIHPSLLPAFPGLEAQQQAFAYGVKLAGCTVHFVDEELDHGAIIVQKAVPVVDNDDEHTLAARILEQEHIAYSEAIDIVLNREFQLVGRRFIASGERERAQIKISAE